MSETIVKIENDNGDILSASDVMTMASSNITFPSAEIVLIGNILYLAGCITHSDNNIQNGVAVATMKSGYRPKRLAISNCTLRKGTDEQSASVVYVETGGAIKIMCYPTTEKYRNIYFNMWYEIA